MQYRPIKRGSVGRWVRARLTAFGFAATAALAAACGVAHAGPVYSFTTIDVPGAASTIAAGINNGGVIAGTFVSSGQPEGFVRAPDGTITTFLINGAPTNATGINNLGQIVGYAGGLGFIRNADGSFITFAVPSLAAALGINDSGAVVGYTSGPLGFLRNSDGSIAIINDPGSSNTVAQGINSAGQIVGNINSETQAFLRQADGTFQTFVFPDASVQTAAFAINDLGDIGGFYDVQFNHGFLELSDGTFLTIDDPLRGTVSQVLGLNDSRDLVGLYTDTDGITHGYLATPVPEPSGFAMFGIALVTLALTRGRRVRFQRTSQVLPNASIILALTPAGGLRPGSDFGPQIPRGACQNPKSFTAKCWITP